MPMLIDEPYLPPYDMVSCAEGVGKKIMLPGASAEAFSDHKTAWKRLKNTPFPCEFRFKSEPKPWKLCWKLLKGVESGTRSSSIALARWCRP